MPELLFKTITQQSFTINVDETATIGEVKRKIEDTKGKESFPVENQKLIFNGKVLDDATLVSTLNIVPSKFFVVMVMRKAAQPLTATAAAASSAAAEPKVADVGQPTAAKSAETKAEGSSDSKTSADKSKSSASLTDVPSEHSQTLANIEAMGYPREEVVRALKAAFFDADRAVEYLCTGIPEGLSLQPAGDGVVGPAAGGEEEMTGFDIEDPQQLQFLAQSPQFQQLRELVRADPTTLPQIIQQIASTNPQLMELIRTNQDAFLQLLNDGQPLGGDAGGMGAAGAELGGEGAAAAAGDVAAALAEGAMPRRVEIPATAEDREAITRLVSMGFPETLVVEAYFACDKNEDLAVNYILARMDEQGGQ